jgi:hypothetical protein
MKSHFLLTALFSMSVAPTSPISTSSTYPVRTWKRCHSCLTFYTGLFVGGEETEMNLIKDLAISYIKKPSCIILLTVACESMSASDMRYHLLTGDQPILSTRAHTGWHRNTIRVAIGPSVRRPETPCLGSIQQRLTRRCTDKAGSNPQDGRRELAPINSRGARGHVVVLRQVSQH